jgi:phosphohistidine phosphatase
MDGTDPEMLRLLLLRHAKSSWADPGMANRDRPLAPRGRRAAERMAGVIAARADLSPDRILCSPTRRTRETLAPLSSHIGDASRALFLDELYEPAAGDYRHVVASHGGSSRHLLVIGHNPAIQATALSLVGSADDKTALQIAAKFPTAALAVIGFDTRTWSEIQPKSGRLEAFIRPRDLEEADGG